MRKVALYLVIFLGTATGASPPPKVVKPCSPTESPQEPAAISLPPTSEPPNCDKLMEDNLGETRYSYSYTGYPAECIAPVQEYTGNETKPAFLYSNDQGNRIVVFYKATCPYSQAFKPEFITFAKDLASERQDVSFYTVSCPVHGRICRYQGIKSVPELKLFPAGSTKSTYRSSGYVKGRLSGNISEAIRHRLPPVDTQPFEDTNAIKDTVAPTQAQNNTEVPGEAPATASPASAATSLSTGKPKLVEASKQAPPSPQKSQYKAPPEVSAKHEILFRQWSSIVVSFLLVGLVVYVSLFVGPGGALSHFQYKQLPVYTTATNEVELV